MCVPQLICKSQRTISGNQFSPSTMCKGIKLSLSSLVACTMGHFWSGGTGFDLNLSALDEDTCARLVT